MRRPRRLLPLVVLLTAAFLFRIGNSAAALALPWLALTHTGDAVWAGVAAASGVAATVVGSWFGGGLIDRWGPAPVALVAGAVGGAATAMIPLLESGGRLDVPVLVLLVMLGAAFDAPGVAAQDSRLPELGRLAGLSLARVATAKAFMGHTALLGGPLLAGACIGLLGASRTLFLTAVGSVLAGLLAAAALARGERSKRRRQLGKRRGGEVFAPRDREEGHLAGGSAGLLHLVREPLLGRLVAIVTIAAAALSGAIALVLPALFLEAGRPASEFGLFVSAQGVGGLVGLAAHATFTAKLKPRFGLAGAYLTCAAVLLLLTFVPRASWLVALGLCTGVMTAPVSPLLNAAIYGRTPTALRGRVLGATSAFVMAASSVVIFLMGLGIERWGAVAMLGAAGVVTLAAALLSLRLRFEPAPRVHLVERN